MIKPPKLQIGDTVGIIAPSSGPSVYTDLKNSFNKGIEVLKNKFGLKVKLGKNINKKHYYSAGTSQERANDLNNMWKDPEVKAVIMAFGGNTANNILDKIDYDFIKQNPKIFCGISDGTILLNAIHKKTGLITYHGPDLCYAFGKNLSEQIKNNYKECWFDGKIKTLNPVEKFKYELHKNKKYLGWKSIRKGKCSEVLIGGHIGCFNSLITAGIITPNDLKDKILFLEGTSKVGELDRAFTDLRLNGIYNNIKGIILGHFEWSQDDSDTKKTNRPVSDILLEASEKYNFPIIEIGELGHCVENYVFPIGCQATIDADNLKITIDESTVL